MLNLFQHLYVETLKQVQGDVTYFYLLIQFFLSLQF